MSVTCNKPSTPPKSTKAPYSVTFLNNARKNFTFLNPRHRVFQHRRPLFFQNRTPRNHKIATVPVHLQNLKPLGRTHQMRNVRLRTNINLTRRQKTRSHPSNPTTYPPLTRFLNNSLNRSARVIYIHQTRPRLFTPRLLTRQNNNPLRVF